MKKIIEFFKNWFEKNGLIKILAAFAILISCALLIRSFPNARWISYVGAAAGIYLLLTTLIFTIAGIVNSIKDVINRKKKE